MSDLTKSRATPGATRAVPGTLERTLMHVEHLADDYGGPYETRTTVADLHRATVVTSLLRSGKDVHAPVLDLDIAHRYTPPVDGERAVLELDLHLSRRRYRSLLRALYRAGITSTAQVDAMIARTRPFGSEIAFGVHSPIFEIEVEHLLVASSTAGHAHLYLDFAITWRAYKRLLRALAKAGVIEPGYAKASIERKHTAVRVPWLRKG